MKVLLDTNVIIHREAYKVSNIAIGQLYKWLDHLHYSKYIHQITKEEMLRHHNNDTSSSMGIKLDAYNLISTFASVDMRIQDIIDKEDKSENDKNDSLLLNELVSERVDLMITEDKKIHKKALSLGMGDKVFTIARFVEKAMLENPGLVNYKVLSVKKVTFGHIDVADSFFNSFREDYQGFNKWFNKKFNESVYVSYFEDKLVGFLYLKIEGGNELYTDITPVFPPKKRLKIGTLKVGLNGYRIGERFLKIAFDNALLHKVDEIYVTVFEKTPEQARLIELLTEWGFREFGIKETPTGHEKVLVRDFGRVSDRDNPKHTFPYISKSADVYIVPIYPDYHTELFPDSILNTESPANFSESEPHRNALNKVYISHSRERNLISGDVILFYRTGGKYKSVVSTIGIVEKIHNNIKSLDELYEICYKKTFFTKVELKAYWDRYSEYRPFVVEFLYSYSLPKRLNLATLIELKVIPGVDDAPRGFRKLSWEQFLAVIKNSNSDESLVVN